MRNFGNSTKNKCPRDMAVRMRTPWVGERVPLVLAGFIKEGSSRTRAHEERKGEEAFTPARVSLTLYKT